MKHTSYELSQKLKDAGAPQDSELVWCATETGTLCEIHNSESRIPIVFELNGGSTFSAFDSDELFSWFRCNDLYPDILTSDKENSIRLVFGEGPAGAHWETGPVDCIAETLGLMKLWCLREGFGK